jgi:hypothetical protein
MLLKVFATPSIELSQRKSIPSCFSTIADEGNGNGKVTLERRERGRTGTLDSIPTTQWHLR